MSKHPKPYTTAEAAAQLAQSLDELAAEAAYGVRWRSLGDMFRSWAEDAAQRVADRRAPFDEAEETP